MRWWAPDQSGSTEVRRWASGQSDSIEGVGRIVDSGPHWHLSGVGQPRIPVDEGVPDLSSGDGSTHVGVGGDSSTVFFFDSDTCDFFFIVFFGSVRCV